MSRPITNAEQPGAEAVAKQPPLLPNISAGLIIGVLQIFLALSYAALIFSGDLSTYVSRGIGLALVGMIVNGVIIAAFTSLSGTVGGSQGVPAAIMAVMAAAIALEIPAGPSSLESLVTVVAAIALVALSTGLFFWILGYFRLGGLVRFLPYPVVGGFLAGTGWLLLTGAISMMVDQSVSFSTISLLFQPDVLVHWLPGLLLAVVMLIVTRRSDHFLVLPLFLIGAVLLFFAVAWINGYSPTDLEAGAWLLGPFPEESALWRPITPTMLGQVDWGAIVGQIANIVAIMAVSAISLLLNAGGLELATDRDMEVNHELRVAGIANMLTGLAAGLVGFKQLSLSTLNFRLGGNSRLPGLIGAVICLLVLVAGAEVLSFFPKMVIGSLLLLLGLNFLYEWVVEGLFKLPKIDYAIVLVILFVTMTAGFLEAVALGLLLAVILFVVSYSQVDVVRHELDGSTYRSRVSRTRAEERVLTERGQELYILQLQGFIFFGTANHLLNQLRRRINDTQQVTPDMIILDFLRVTGLDSTGMLSFTRMKQLAENTGIVLVFSEPNERVLEQLENGGLRDDSENVRIFPSLDAAVEWGEERLLEDAGMKDVELPSLEQQLQEILYSEEDSEEKASQLAALLERMEQLAVDSGQVLIRKGDAADDLFFVGSGQVTAQLQRPDRPPVRLETAGGGSVIGEIGFYLGQERTADVIADTPGILYRMTLADLRELEESNPEVASTLHQILVHLLAERVIHLTNSVKALER